MRITDSEDIVMRFIFGRVREQVRQRSDKVTGRLPVETDICSISLQVPDLVVEGVDDQHIEQDVAVVIRPSRPDPLVEIPPEAEIGLPVIGGKARGPVAAVVGVSVGADVGEAVPGDDPVDPVQGGVPVQGPERGEQVHQMAVGVIIEDLLRLRIEPHIAAAAEQIRKDADVPGEQGQELGQQPVFAAGIVEGRGDHLLPLPVVADAQKQPLGVILDVRLPGAEGPVGLGEDPDLAPGAQDTQDVGVAELWHKGNKGRKLYGFT